MRYLTLTTRQVVASGALTADDQLSKYILGKRKGKWALLPFQLAVLIGIGITYIVVGGDNLAAFCRSVSPQRGNFPKWIYYILFGAVQLILSQVGGHALPLDT